MGVNTGLPMGGGYLLPQLENAFRQCDVGIVDMSGTFSRAGRGAPSICTPGMVSKL